MYQASAARPPLIRNEGVKAEIRRSLTESASAFNRGDVETILEAYAPDAVVLPPNSPAVQGIKAIRQLWEALLAAGYRNAAFVTGCENLRNVPPGGKGAGSLLPGGASSISVSVTRFAAMSSPGRIRLGIGPSCRLHLKWATLNCHTAYRACRSTGGIDCWCKQAFTQPTWIAPRRKSP
jgi:hypothetical protein